MIWRTSGIVALQQELVFQLGGMRRYSSKLKLFSIARLKRPPF